MSKPVLFVTGLGRDVSRSENLMALYEAYQGEKTICHICNREYLQEARNGKYGLIVTDIFPTDHFAPTIMLWHSIQGGKHIGLDEQGTYYGREMADNIDAIIAAGSGIGKEMWHQCTGVPLSRIYDFGMPRTDRYIGKRKGDGHTVGAKKRMYLYVPTFRAFDEPDLPQIDWDYIDENLTDGEVLVVKAHPQSHTLTIHDHYKHIVEADRMEASVNYLYDADVLITDYSSIIFDGYLLRKPAVLFEPNKGYVQKRGMYLEYPFGYCSRFAKTEEALLNHLRNATHLHNAEKKCIKEIADACDGHSCERICELIKQIQN